MNHCRRIAHLDMDAFFASVELLRHPDLRGKPVVIGGNPNSRGVVSTATYEARAFGVHSGIPLSKAARLCPTCIFLPVDHSEYHRFSSLFKNAVYEFTDRVENVGVDEIFIDLSDIKEAVIDGGFAVALDLQKRVFEATNLTCSIGVAPNKLLAKMASEMNKPRGVTVLFEEDLVDKIWPLMARKINGIGPKADAKLESFGIRTIGDLARTPLEELIDKFGSNYGHWLHEVSYGRDDREIITDSEPKSISRETTFEKDLHFIDNSSEIIEVLSKIGKELSSDLKHRGYCAKTIGVKAKYVDFKVVTRERSLIHGVQDEQKIHEIVIQCLNKIPPVAKVRLLGIRAGNLEPSEQSVKESSQEDLLF